MGVKHKYKKLTFCYFAAAVPCNDTSQCYAATNECQFPSCEDGVCVFMRNIQNQECCTEVTECEVIECMDRSCIDNICYYRKTPDCSTVGCGDIIGAFIGFTVLGCLLTCFIVVLAAMLIQVCVRKFKERTPTPPATYQTPGKESKVLGML